MAKQLVMRWGNSLAFRIPAGVARSLGLEERTPVKVEIKGSALVITPAEVLPEFSDADFRRGIKLLANAKERRKRLAQSDIGAPIGREVQ